MQKLSLFVVEEAFSFIFHLEESLQLIFIINLLRIRLSSIYNQTAAIFELL